MIDEALLDRMIDAAWDVKDRAGHGADRDDIRHEVRAVLAVIEREFELRPKGATCGARGFSQSIGCIRQQGHEGADKNDGLVMWW